MTQHLTVTEANQPESNTFALSTNNNRLSSVQRQCNAPLVQYQPHAAAGTSNTTSFTAGHVVSAVSAESKSGSNAAQLALEQPLQSKALQVFKYLQTLSMQCDRPAHDGTVLLGSGWLLVVPQAGYTMCVLNNWQHAARHMQPRTKKVPVEAASTQLSHCDQLALHTPGTKQLARGQPQPGGLLRMQVQPIRKPKANPVGWPPWVSFLELGPHSNCFVAYKF